MCSVVLGAHFYAVFGKIRIKRKSMRTVEGKSHSHSGQLVKRTGRISSYVAVSVTSETAEWLLCKSRSNSRIVRSGCSRAGIPPYSSHNVDSQVSR